jgi:cell division protein FtsZ
MKEVRDVMATIRHYAHEEATIIFGTVFEDCMEDQLRVTVVATGLGGAVRMAAKPKLQPMQMPAYETAMRTGTDNRPVDAVGTTSEQGFPDVFKPGRARNAAVEAMAASGVDKYDIPAFLRKQAD